MKFITALITIIAITSKVSAKCAFEKLGYKCCKSTTHVEAVDENGTWGIENNQWCGITINTPHKKRQWWGGQDQNQGNPWEQQQQQNQGNPWEQQQQQQNQGNPWEQQQQQQNQGNPWEQQQQQNQGNPWEQQQ